jgi:hypothetical protein
MTSYYSKTSSRAPIINDYGWELNGTWAENLGNTMMQSLWSILSTNNESKETWGEDYGNTMMERLLSKLPGSTKNESKEFIPNF